MTQMKTYVGLVAIQILPRKATTAANQKKNAVHETKKIQEEKEYLNLIEWETSPGSLLGWGIRLQYKKKVSSWGRGGRPTHLPTENR